MTKFIDHINAQEVLRMIIENEAPDNDDFCSNLRDEVLLQLWRAISNNAGTGGPVNFGENSTGPLVANTLYRFKFTDIKDHEKKTKMIVYKNASYILQAIDPKTGAVVFCDLLADGDISGTYTPQNSFRIRVAEDMPEGLIIRHFGK